jgi:hypothetical protein
MEAVVFWELIEGCRLEVDHVEASVPRFLV